MVTLKVKIGVVAKLVEVHYIDLDQHWPLDVFKFIVERGLHKPPPTGTIWIMKLPVLQGNEPVEIDHFAPLSACGIDANTDLRLLEISR